MRSRPIWITSGLIAGLLTAAASFAAEGTSAKPKTKAQKTGSKVEARSGSVSTVKRPQRTVTPPTLTSRDLDAMLASRLKSEGVKPAGPAADAEFARRLWLDLTGTLPTPEQIKTFVNDSDPRKRSKLIDRLLADENFGRNWARYWRDAISYRATVANPRLTDFDGFEDWLAQQLNANRPWDEIARQIIAGTGNSADNGAVVFTAAHQARPAEVAGEVSRLFMGVQIQCAECHDHPTDPWKREQFHEFAAFFANTTARRNAKNAKKANGIVVDTRKGRPRYAMPDLKDPRKTIPIDPKFFFATADTIPGDLSAQQRRELAASYVTGQDNPYFARAFINRVWTALIGSPFYSPVDDMGPAREGEATEVLDRLADQWTASGYDVKWLFRTILNTQTYARDARASTSPAGQAPFAAACPTQLRADQILDALDEVLDSPFAGGNRRNRRNRRKGNAAAAVRGRNNVRRIFNAVFGVDPSVPADEVMGSIPQALFLMNDPRINRAIQATPDSLLGKILENNPQNPSAIDALYLRVLARKPSDAERQTCLDYIAQVKDRKDAFEDLLWALINSSEFISRR